MRSFGANNWAPFALLVGTTVVLCVLALRLESTRDLGAGLLPDRPGPRTASTFTPTAFGLTLRLQRGSIIGWSAGVLVGGLFFGEGATAMSGLLSKHNATDITRAFLGGAPGSILTGLMGYFTMAIALLVAAFVIQSAATMRAEEADGALELQWTGVLSRLRWAASRMAAPAIISALMLGLSGLAAGATYGAAIKDSSQAAHYLGVALAYWPTMLLLVVLCAAWIPRASSTVVWAVYGVIVLVSMFGGLFKLPKAVADGTPFTAIERTTSGTFSAVPLVVIFVVAAAFAVVGLLRFRVRDVAVG